MTAQLHIGEFHIGIQHEADAAKLHEADAAKLLPRAHKVSTPTEPAPQEQSVSWATSKSQERRRTYERRRKKIARSTELLRVQAEEIQVNQQILTFRKEHQLRMLQIEKQREKFQQLKEQFKKRIDENAKFVAEQLNKQMKAEGRYRSEKKALGILQIDLLDLEDELQFLDKRLATVNNEIRRQQMCKELLIKTSKVLTGSNSNKRAVAAASPENEVSTLIQKFEALELEDAQRQLDDLNSGHEIDRLNTMLTLDTQKSKYDAIQNKNRSTEQFLFFSNNKLRQETIDKSMITRSIHNLLAKCKSKHFKSLTGGGDADELAQNGSYIEKLDHIEDFILHQHAVIVKTRLLMETVRNIFHRPSIAGNRQGINAQSRNNNNSKHDDSTS